MREIVTFCEIKSGVVRIFKRKEFDQAIKVFGEGRHKLTISKIYRKRSTQQNRYLFGVIYETYLQCFKETYGYDYCMEVTNQLTGEILRIPLSEKEKKEKVHEFFKALYNEGKTTTDLTTIETEEYYSRCREHIKFEFNYDTLLPNEQSELWKNE